MHARDGPEARRGKPSAATRRTSRRFAPATGNDASASTTRSSNNNNGKAPPLPVAAGRVVHSLVLSLSTTGGLTVVQTSVALYGADIGSERLETDE